MDAPSATSRHPQSATPQRPGAAPWLALLGCTIALSLWTSTRVEGALFADVVEYLERARGFVRGEEIVDAHAIRAAGVTLIHVPALWLGRVLGIEEGPWVLTYAAWVHALITALLVAATVLLARTVARASGSGSEGALRAGWLAGVVALSYPTLLQFSAIPMTDVAAGAALAMGVERTLFGPATARRGAVAGAWLGFGALLAFKVIPLVALALFAGLVVRAFADGLRSTAAFATTAFLALAALAVVQCAFDGLTYGTFGVGLWTYLLSNFGPQAGTLLYEIGLIDLGQWIYQQGNAAYEKLPLEAVSRSKDDFSMIASRTWYLDHFDWLSPRWMAAIAGLGVVACVWSTGGTSTRARIATRMRALAPLGIAAIYAGLTSIKGAKEMRIWIPILPLFAAYAGRGLAVIAGPANGRAARGRAALAAALSGAALLQGLTLLRTAPTAPFAAFERAAQWLAEAPGPEGFEGPLKVAASYHWAVLFRTPSDWQLEKLPHQLDTLGSIDDESAWERTRERLVAQDVLLLQTSLLTAPWSGELVALLARDFHVAAAFWDRNVDTGIGAVVAFARRVPGDEPPRRLYGESVSPEDRGGVPLERQLGPEREAIDLAEVRIVRLPGDGLHWVELAFDPRGERVVAGYVLGLSIANTRGAPGYTTFRRFGWGRVDARDWKRGTRWTEGLLVAPDQGPLALSVECTPIAKGERVSLGIDLVTLGADPEGRTIVTGRLEAIERGPEGADGATVVATFEVGAGADEVRLESALAGE
ncbi:MAG: hypothetical protein AAGA20_18505 [Planctomycetota bacterium]